MTLPALPRRSLLAAFGLAPAVVALPALASPPDAELLEAVRRLGIASGLARRLGDKAAAVELANADRAPPLPSALTMTVQDFMHLRLLAPVGRAMCNRPGEPISAEQVALIRTFMAGQPEDRASDFASGWLYRRDREILAAHEAHLAACEAHAHASGLRRAEALADAAWRVADDLEAEVLRLPATTPQGVRAKAQVVAAIIGEPDGTYEDAAMRGFLADLRAVVA